MTQAAGGQQQQEARLGRGKLHSCNDHIAHTLSFFSILPTNYLLAHPLKSPSSPRTSQTTMSYANAAAKNSSGGGAQPSSEFLEGSHSAGGANAPSGSLDVDSNKVSIAQVQLG